MTEKNNVNRINGWESPTQETDKKATELLEEAAKLDLESVIIVGITRKGGLHVRTYMPHTDALVACEVLRKRLLDKLDSGEGDWP